MNNHLDTIQSLLSSFKKPTRSEIIDQFTKFRKEKKLTSLLVKKFKTHEELRTFVEEMKKSVDAQNEDDFDEKLKVLNQLISDNMNLFTSENNNDITVSVDVEMKEEELHEFIQQNERE